MSEKVVNRLCQGLLDHLDATGEEMFEKNLILPDGSIAASVFVIIGDNAEELTGLVREWASKNGMKRRS